MNTELITKIDEMIEKSTKNLFIVDNLPETKASPSIIDKLKSRIDFSLVSKFLNLC